MSDYWEKKYMGISQPINADVYVLQIGFDFAISGRDWQTMDSEEKVDEFRRKFRDAIELTLDEIEHAVKYYQKYKYGIKENE